MSESPADAPDAVAAGDEAEDAPKRRPRFRPLALLLQLGAAAGAITSIFAVVQLVAPGGDEERRTTSAATRPTDISLSLEPNSVRVLTRRQFIKSLGFEPYAEEPEDLDELGFTVTFRLETRGYRPAEKLLVCYRLWEQTKTGERPAVAPVCDDIEITRDLDDEGTITSTFMLLPRRSASYRVAVGVHPPGATEQNPGHPDEQVTTAEFERRGSA